MLSGRIGRVRATRLFATLLAVTFATGCIAYRTPGGGVRMELVAKGDIAARFNRKPAAHFPVHIAVARVQAPGYESATTAAIFGEGNFALVATRDVEKPADFERIAALPRVAAVAPISVLLLPRRLDSDEDLRLAAASLNADMLIIYTFSTQFVTNESVIAPLRVFYLGIFPDQSAKVITTASAAIFDVRTGFVYAAAEATAHENQLTTVWINAEVIDQARQRTERKAFEGLVDQIASGWPAIVREHDH